MITRHTIWTDDKITKDTYAQFAGSFSLNEKKEEMRLDVGFDGHAAVYINGRLAFFGAGADYPWHRLYYSVDVTEWCEKENTFVIEVWHPGIDSQTYIENHPNLFFTFTQGDRVVAESSENTLSRRHPNYRSEYCKTITTQMGMSFYYDNTKIQDAPYKQSVCSKEAEEFHLRETGYLTLGERAPVTVMETEYGYQIDLHEETVGFIELDFDSPCQQEILIAYGEHLQNGRVLRKIAERDFSVEFCAKEGSNAYLNPFRRLAGRYLEVHCEKPLDIRYIGLRPTDRMIRQKERYFKDPLLQRIYEVSVNTLKKCMHEHYEDCPWREQAMYTLDSRNQMLCGYYAFDDHDYVRENLRFIAKGQREDGLLSLCFPAGTDLPIPFFSLVYLMQIKDYVTYTKDESLAAELKQVVDRIQKVFSDRMDETGLIANFPAPCWNFYEWTEGSNDGLASDGPIEKKYDLILNAMYVIFCELYRDLYGEDILPPHMTDTIRETFYCPQKGLYRLSTQGEHYSQLGNSFAILIGLGDEKLAERLTQDPELIGATLSMNTFYYDALLRFGDRYRSFIIEDIREKYGYMLENGATTFWETEKGWQDFEGAGSLCHGWSAIPVYYLSELVS